MNPIFNKKGQTIAWFEDGYVYHLSGRTVLAFIENEDVYTYRARHLGRLSKNFFRDKTGRAVAFLSGASDGPITPTTQIPPISPIPVIPPITPITSIPPTPPTDSFSWSNLSWEDYINR